jgi:hypothetical protein
LFYKKLYFKKIPVFFYHIKGVSSCVYVCVELPKCEKVNIKEYKNNNNKEFINQNKKQKKKKNFGN